MPRRRSTKRVYWLRNYQTELCDASKLRARENLPTLVNKIVLIKIEDSILSSTAKHNKNTIVILFIIWSTNRLTNYNPMLSMGKFFILNKHFPTLMYVEGSDHLDVLVWLKNGRMSGILDGGVMVKVVV